MKDLVLALIEFDSEYRALKRVLKIKKIEKKRVWILCPDFSFRKRIESENFSCINPLDYFERKDHDECLLKIDEVESFSKKYFENEARQTYYHSFIFYSSFFLAHLFYIETLILNILKKDLKFRTILYPYYIDKLINSPRLELGESCLEVIANSVREKFIHQLKLVPFCCRFSKEQAKIRFKNRGNLFVLVIRLANKISLFGLKKALKKKTILLSSLSHNIDQVVQQALGEQQNTTIVGMIGLNRVVPPQYSYVVFLFKVLKHLFFFLIGKKERKNMDYLFDFYPTPNFFHHKWKKKMEELFDSMKKNNSLGEIFLDAYKGKVFKGIVPLLSSLEKLGEELTPAFKENRPVGIFSPHSLNGTHLMGDLSHELGIHGMLVSHGSHTAPQEPIIENELFRHGMGLINAQYDHVAVQSPLADNYLKHYKINRLKVKTGPILWGGQFKKWGCENIKVVTHASSQKPRESQRFLFYETIDEYVDSILSLVKAVKGMNKVKCVIRFRQMNFLTLEGLKSIIPEQSNVEISTKGPFLDVLARTDLLVSYSSTTMEEAVENRIPVLQYSTRNKFHYLPSYTISQGEDLKFSPIYSMTEDFSLREAIEKILKVTNIERESFLIDEAYEKFSIPKQDRIDLAEVINAWVKNWENPV